jgi:hypothetical protein
MVCTRTPAPCVVSLRSHSGHGMLVVQPQRPVRCPHRARSCAQRPPCTKHDGSCRSRAYSTGDARLYHQAMNSRARVRLTTSIFVAPCCRPAHRGRLRRRARDRCGTGVLRVALSAAPGRRPATPPSRHYERDARTRYVKLESTAPLCNAQEIHRDGLGAKKSPRWSAERRASPGCADCVSWSARGRKGERSRPAGLRHWPAKGCRCTPSACRRSAPSRCAREIGKARTSS